MTGLEALNEYENDLPIDKLSELENNMEATAESAKSFLSDAESLRAMIETPGWKIFKEFVADNIKAHTEKLILATQLEEIQRLQEYLKACHILIQYPEITVSEASHFAETLSVENQDPE